MPKVEADRYYASQWDDLWAYVVGNPGSIEDGNDGVKVLITAPGWKGTLPQGVTKAVTGESSILGTLTRTQYMIAEGGMDRVRQIQGEYKLEPLSAYEHKAAPPAAPKVGWPTWIDNAETTPKYWEYAAKMMEFTTRNDKDRKMYDYLRDLGIDAGKPFDFASASTEQQQALAAGITAARDQLAKMSMEKGINSDLAFGDRHHVGEDYLMRALGVYMGIFGNVAKQAVYYPYTTDTQGTPLNGSIHDYTVTFAADQLPPVDYFWSVTMYNLPQRLLVANPINRCSLGSDTPGLVKNADGGLTLYVSKTDPGGEKTKNWLPANDGPIYMMLRTYGPKDPILNRTWKLPLPTLATN